SFRSAESEEWLRHFSRPAIRLHLRRHGERLPPSALRRELITEFPPTAAGRQHAVGPDDLREVVEVWIADDVGRVLALLHAPDGVAEKRPGRGDRRVVGREVLVSPVLNRAGRFGRAEVLRREVLLRDAGEAPGRHELAVL